MRAWRGIARALALASGVFMAATASGEESFAAVVRGLQDELTASMKQGDSWDYERRFSELEPVVEGSHHFGLIARVVAGPFWSDFTEEEKTGLANALSRLAVANLASGFDNHDGQRFEILETRALRRGQFLVRTVLRRGGRGDVSFDYILADADGTPGIINVVVDGVSDLALKRAEYQEVLAERGVDGLMSEIGKQIDEMGGVPGESHPVE
ncbi:MAG: ABC transporter substrate-binding protein [Puniceicoccaceae bacterium]